MSVRTYAFSLIIAFLGTSHVASAQSESGASSTSEMKACAPGLVRSGCVAQTENTLFLLDATTLSRFDKLRKAIPQFAPTVPDHCGSLKPIPPMPDAIRFVGNSVVLDLPFDTSCMEPPEKTDGAIDPVPTRRNVPKAVACEESVTRAQPRPTALGDGRRPAAPPRGQNSLNCFEVPVASRLGPKVFLPPEMAPVWEISLDPDCMRDPDPENECEVVFRPRGGDIDPDPDSNLGFSKKDIRSRLNASDALGRASIEIDCDLIPGVCPTDWAALDIVGFLAVDMTDTLDQEEIETFCRETVRECTSQAATPDDVLYCTEKEQNACSSLISQCTSQATPQGLCPQPGQRGFQECHQQRSDTRNSCILTNVSNETACNAVCSLTSRTFRAHKLNLCLKGNFNYEALCTDQN